MTPCVLTPARMLGLTRVATRTSLGNARAAGGVLARAVADRRALAPDLAGGLAALDEQECLRLLAGRSVGRLAYVARAGTPDIVPVNYVMNVRDVLIRSGPGPKLQAAERGERVAFAVDDLDEQTHTGWSVVVAGRARVLPPHETCRLVLPTPWSDGPRRHVVRIAADRITGRRIG